jgi:hypothetical protein
MASSGFPLFTLPAPGGRAPRDNEIESGIRGFAVIFKRPRAAPFEGVPRPRFLPDNRRPRRAPEGETAPRMTILSSR